MTDDEMKKIAAYVAATLVGVGAVVIAPHIKRAGVAVGSHIRKGAWSMGGVR